MKNQSKTKQTLIQKRVHLNEASEYAENIINTVREPLIVLDQDLRVVTASRSFYEFFKVKPEETEGQLIYNLGNEQWDIPKLRELLETVLPEKTTFDNYEVEHDFATIGKRIMLLNARQIQKALGKERVILLAIEDITERKRAEKELKESENKYRLLADNVDDVIFVLDMNLNYTYISPSVKILTGYEQEEWLNLRVSETMTPSSWDLATKKLSFEIEKSEQGEITKLQILQLEMEQKDGSTVWTEVKVSFIRDENQRPVGIIGVSRDITERKRVENALSESELRLNLALETNQTGVWSLNLLDHTAYRTLIHDHIFGYETLLPNWTYEMFLEHVLPDDRLEVDRRFSEATASKSDWKFECRIRRTDGEVRWILAKGRHIQNLNDEPVQMLGIVQDITERKQVEEAQQKSEEQFRLLAENARDTIWTMDMNLQYTYMSPYVKQTLDYTPEEYILMPLNEIMTPASLELCMQVLTEEMEIEKRGKRDPLWSRTIEIEHIHRSGKIVPVEIKMTFIRNAAGQATGILGYTRDITERKQADEELQQTLESLRKAVGATIQSMVSAVEMRDPYTAGHQLRVANVARAIAKEMGLPQDKIDGIRMADSIHDIGKLSIPAEILSKPTKLTNVEFSLIKEHSHNGYEMLKNVESPWPLAQIVYQHHERMDGSGYPRNLKGDEILIEARIMAVADVVEAIASHRPYRPSLGIDAALAEIEKNKGTHYDKTVADACLRLFREKDFQLKVA
jgi:PAS domain S-box-containing protein